MKLEELKTLDELASILKVKKKLALRTNFLERAGRYPTAEAWKAFEV